MADYQIVWTDRAKKDLQKVYSFSTELMGEEKAFAMITSLLEKLYFLSDAKFVRMGAVDEEFKHLKYQYKKIIEKDIKVTYRISSSKPIIYINRVFDTRQNPRKTNNSSSYNQAKL